MKTKKLPPQPVNWANPQWRYAASGIRCRADWKGAYVFETEVGPIIAYSRAHAEDMARSVLEEREPDLEVVNQMQELFY